MTLVFNVISWSTILMALTVFGFAPGAVLRLIVLAFDRNDPRRRELLAELHAVPRMERPFWVAEQLEVALVEGLGQRLIWAATGRIIYRWHLGSGVERNRAYPDSFNIPPVEECEGVTPGMDVRLMFEMRDGFGERMWVTVIAVEKRRLVGTLNNLPVGIPRLLPGDKIKFQREHIIGIWRDDTTLPAGDEGHDPDQAGTRLVHGGCNGHIANGHDPGAQQIDPPTSPQ